MTAREAIKRPSPRFRIERAALSTIACVARLLPLHGPLPAGPALGGLIGRIAWIFSPRRRKVALRNLRLAFGDSMTEAKRRRVARAA